MLRSQAAEDRRRLDAIMPKGPRKVGGGEGIMRLFGPKEVRFLALLLSFLVQRCSRAHGANVLFGARMLITGNV